MLFNSYEFLFLFLPVTLAGFHLLRTAHPTLAIRWLALCSLAFYGYWNPLFLPLLVGSIAINYAIGRVLWDSQDRRLLVAGIALNLAALGWFKYAHFIAGTLLGAAHVPEFIATVVLPLAISFFTFQQIAFLVDVWRGRTAPGRWDTYALFVAFFPQLIAGPIVRHQQIEPQLRRIGDRRRGIGRMVLIGAVLVVIGLFKKVVLADTLAPFADGVFDFAGQGYRVGLLDAWLGMFAYTLQLYFDFSGYSDMAVGLGLMCGLRLPINFFSPYKATSIVEFWRRWHITLSAFFRDYVYIPLGGSRSGPARRYFNLLLVMALVGLWHGAGWTFVLWGAYHGVLLALAHAWRSRAGRGAHASPLQAGMPVAAAQRLTLRRVLSWACTLAAVCLGWVLFRAETLDAAGEVYAGLLAGNGLTGSRLALLDTRLYMVGYVLVGAGFLIALALPNSIQWIRREIRVEGARTYLLAAAGGRTRPGPRLQTRVALGLGAMAYLAVTTMSTASTEFLYFNF